MAKRSGKFYFKNEKEVMLDLGLKPTKGSGSGWIEKEDGQNEHIIAQLKSTDAQSIKVSLLDIQKLEYHAATSHKIPMFVIQFLETNDLFILSRPMDMPVITKYIECGICEKQPEQIIGLEEVDKPIIKSKTISSGGKSKNSFWKDKEREREKWQKEMKQRK